MKIFKSSESPFVIVFFLLLATVFLIGGVLCGYALLDTLGHEKEVVPLLDGWWMLYFFVAAWISYEAGNDTHHLLKYSSLYLLVILKVFSYMYNHPFPGHFIGLIYSMQMVQACIMIHILNRVIFHYYLARLCKLVAAFFFCLAGVCIPGLYLICWLTSGKELPLPGLSQFLHMSFLGLVFFFKLLNIDTRILGSLHRFKRAEKNRIKGPRIGRDRPEEVIDQLRTRSRPT